MYLNGDSRITGHLVSMSPDRLPREVQLEGDPQEDPRHTGKITQLAWECLGFPPVELVKMTGKREVIVKNHLLKKGRTH